MKMQQSFFYVKEGGVSVRVCKKAFLNMHSVANGRLDRALKAQVDAGVRYIVIKGAGMNQATKQGRR